jgi:hypothetical protein
MHYGVNSSRHIGSLRQTDEPCLPSRMGGKDCASGPSTGIKPAPCENTAGARGTPANHFLGRNCMVQAATPGPRTRGPGQASPA